MKIIIDIRYNRCVRVQCACACMVMDGVIGSLSTIYDCLWLSLSLSLPFAHFRSQFYLQFNNLRVIHCNRHTSVQSVYNWLATEIFDVLYGLMLVGWLVGWSIDIVCLCVVPHLFGDTSRSTWAFLCSCLQSR